ncbi:MAG: Endonuclease MutS2 [Fimbriimonadaceae bacterium]|nr:Endonuclease MutS2 [Fimbriimonadaceae bacterium]
MDHALRVLEFDELRSRLSKLAETSLGQEACLSLTPSFDREAVERQLMATREADFAIGRSSLPGLHGVYDSRDACERAAKGGTLDGVTLFRVGASLPSMRGLREALSSIREELPILWPIAASLPHLPQLEDRLTSSLDGDGTVRDEASQELADLRRRKRSVAQKLQERIHSYITGRHRDLLSDPIVTQRSGRYVVPLKAEHRGKIKGIVHDTSSTGQTIFIEPEDVLQVGNALREAEAAELAEIERILKALSQHVGREAETITAGVYAAGKIDFELAKARFGYTYRGTIPEIIKTPSAISIRNGAHPLLDAETVVPLSLQLGFDYEVLLITGPNTGGKTVAMKTVGLFVAMAQSGMMVPAGEVKFGPFTQLWADIGDEQSLHQSLSTFSGHIKNIAEALKGLQPGALVLLDEVGAGTDPAEGAALAKALLHTLRDGGARVMASTHYGELKVFAMNHDGFANASMEFDVKSLKPTYRLLVGTPGASHALKIAQRYGIPEGVIRLANENIGVEGQDLERTLQNLETAQKHANRAQGEADRLAARLRQLEKETESKLQEAEEAKRTARMRAHAAIEDLLRDIRLEATEVFDQLKNEASAEAVQRAKDRLAGLQSAGRELAEEFAPTPQPPRASSEAVRLSKGMTVKVEGQALPGVLLEDPRGKTVRVQVGALKLTIAIDRVSPGSADSVKPPGTPRQHLGFKRAQTAVTEINLRELRAEQAKDELEKFIDDSILAGVPFVRIVHGKGEGILRNMTRELLRQHRGVRSYRDGEPAEGGHGVTIANFE